MIMLYFNILYYSLFSNVIIINTPVTSVLRVYLHFLTHTGSGYCSKNIICSTQMKNSLAWWLRVNRPSNENSNSFLVYCILHASPSNMWWHRAASSHFLVFSLWICDPVFVLYLWPDGRLHFWSLYRFLIIFTFYLFVF